MMEHKSLIRYFIFTYLLFWILLGLTGFLISLDIPIIYQNIIKNVCAWTPTFVILLMFRRLYPGISLRGYFAANFRVKTNPWHFIVVIILQLGILFAAVMAYILFNNIEIGSLTLIGAASIIPVLIINLSSGPLGEELGWRGYALKVYQKKYSPLKSALFVGIVWGLWHLPLMILSGYTGLDLIIYCIAFMIAMLSLSVVITYFYNKSGNILIAMWTHFVFNLLLQIVIIDLLTLVVYIAAGYLIFAVILVAIRKHDFLIKADTIIIK